VKLLRTTGLLTLLGTLFSLPVPADVAATARSGLIQDRVLELVNSARAQGRRCGREHFASADPLQHSSRLAAAAAAHAGDMARRGYFDHQAPDGSKPRDRVRRAGYQWRLVGENIAFGPESAEEAVAGWMASPGHCANIMDPRFREMGVAVAQGRKRGHFYWVQDLADPGTLSRHAEPAR
jgi:uncharacterized protein YkwD